MVHYFRSTIGIAVSPYCFIAAALSLSVIAPANGEETAVIHGRVLEFDIAPPVQARQLEVERSRDWQILFVDDFNSDGCSDLLAGDREVLQLAQGDCQGSFSLDAERTIEHAEAEYHLLTSDLDDDGCAEVLGISRRKLIAYRSQCPGPFEKHVIRELRFDLYEGFPVVRKIPGEAFSDVLLPRPETAQAQRFRVRLPHALNSVAVVDVFRWEQLLGAADVDGDGAKEAVSKTLRLYGTFRARDVYAKEESTAEGTWAATFLQGHVWPEVYLGDFNGDGFDDLLARGSGIAGWWLAQSNGRTGLEAPLKFPKVETAALRAVGDIDGDGMAELISCGLQHSEACTAYSLDLRPVSGVRLQSSDTADYSGAEGTFRLPLKDSTSPNLRADHQHYFFRAVPEAALRRDRFTVLAVSKAEFAAEAGRAAHYVEVPEGPKVCLGYNATKGPEIAKWTPELQLCEAHHAWFAVDDTFSKKSNPYDAFSMGFCCPLPAADILLGEVEELNTELLCPEGSVIVGVVADEEFTNRSGIRCQKVNEKKYQLGPPLPGIYVGEGASSRWVQRRIDWSEVPLAIRAGLRRAHLEHFGGDGCISPVPGALYVGTTGEQDCSAHLFRRLFLRNAAAENTPLEMFPDCDHPPDLRNPTSGCK